MGLSSAIDLLVARIESYSPTTDRMVKFRRADKLPTNGVYRLFNIETNISMRPNSDSRPNPWTTDVIVEVYYDVWTEHFLLFKKIINDAEELFARVTYSNSDQWGTANNICVLFRDLSIAEEDGRYVIRLTVSLVYNV
jgi:hypothetical protein